MSKPNTTTLPPSQPPPRGAKPRAAAAPATGAHAQSLAKRVILVVEDDAAIRGLIVRALQQSYAMYEAADGMHASELLATLPTPALVICDVMMPRIDGFSLARLMKADERLKAVPIIFTTAKTGASDVMTGIAIGARHYIQKPFKMADLVERVQKLLR